MSEIITVTEVAYHRNGVCVVKDGFVGIKSVEAIKVKKG